MSRLVFLCLSLSLLACAGTGSSDTGFDSLADSGRDSSTDSTPLPDSEDSGTGSTDSPKESQEDTEEPPPPLHFWELTDPCPNAGYPYAMLFESSQEGWVGCGDGKGLWRTENAGESFAEGHPNTWTGELYVTDLALDPEGSLLVCGRDYGNDSLLSRYRNGTWEDLLHYGNNNQDSSAAQLSNCGVVAAAGDGSLIVASLTAGDISTSSNDGLTWTKEARYWEDANLDAGGYSYYYLLNLVAAGGSYFGAGSDITSPPVFFGPSQHAGGSWSNFHAHTIDSRAEGEIWALATPDDGQTWLAGGRDQRYSSVASGFLYRSEDGGESWSKLAMGGDLDVVQDLAFAADGRHGIAVGHRYPTSHGGFILLTEDGGQSWTERVEDVPPLYVASIVGTDFWVAGENYLARGEF